MRPRPTLALLLLLPVSATAEPARYELDPEHTTVALMVEHVGFAATLALFGEVSGAFTYDLETQELSDLRVTVATRSFNSLLEARDQHVRSADFLNVQAYPEMIFAADGGTPDTDTSGVVEGTLTLLGETRPLALDVTLNKAEDYPFGHSQFTLGVSAQGRLMRSDWGMTYGVDNGLVGDEVRLIIETEALQVE